MRPISRLLRWIPAALLVVGGLALIAVPPHGCFAIPLAVACLWVWPAGAQDQLAAIGLPRRVLVVVGVSLAAVGAAVSLGTGGQFDGHLLHGGDFQTYWLGATVGALHGWSNLFDLQLQRAAWPRMAGAREPFLPFLNTPPVAWLVAPLRVLPYAGAYAVWVGLMTVCTVVTFLVLVPRAWMVPVAIVGAGLWLLPYTLASGQNAIFGALAVAATWRLLRAGRDGWAGVALALVFLRPNATMLIPLALLVAGYWRTFVVWLLLTALLAGASIWSLGREGLVQFVHLGLFVRHSHPHAVQMTILGWLGQNPAALALEALLVVAALAVAWRGGRTPATALAAGVLASLFVTPYIHAQDYLTVLAAAAIVAATSTGTWFGLLLVPIFVVAPPGLVFGGVWEGALLVVEIAWLGWLAWSAWHGRIASDSPGKRPQDGTNASDRPLTDSGPLTAH